MELGNLSADTLILAVIFERLSPKTQQAILKQMKGGDNGRVR